MTQRQQWAAWLQEWHAALELGDRIVTLEFVSPKQIDGDADVIWMDRDAMRWKIRVRLGKQPDGEAVLIHELFHIRSGCMDPRDEAWLWVVARLLVRLKYETA